MEQLIKRDETRILLQGGKHTVNQIAATLGVGRATVFRVQKTLKEGTNLLHKKGAGRPAILRNLIKHSIAQYVRHDKKKTIRGIVTNLGEKSGTKVSKSTIGRCLQEMEYSKPWATLVPMLSEKNKLLRNEWGKKNENIHWCHAVFADEASFWLKPGRVRLWTKRNRKVIQPTTKHSVKLHIWVAFSSMGTFPLCFFRRNMDATFFVNILEWHLIEQAEVFHGQKWFLIQDNDPKHTSRIAKAWMEKNMKKNQREWPSQSPELNPIENIYGWIKQKLYKDNFTSLVQFKKRIQEIWDSIIPQFLAPYYKSMSHRCRLVVEQNGSKINY
ncbi:hypothetical protein LOD99_6186 [Oopsacas minuta]|uniref:Transposase n=1 Tax=Oopsacas minuta TaxID=111878 RepID=A0AAV7JNL8_9METZ|nr:hypothetical protein LOD99_6186 [Oopsacas minuta]